MKKKKKKGQKQSIPDLTKNILFTLARNSGKSFTSRQLHKKTRAANNVKDVRKILAKLVKSGNINQIGEDRYECLDNVDKRKMSSQTIKGTVDAIKSGAAFVISDELENDVFVPKKYLKGAFDKDVVEVQLFKRGRGRRHEGKVVKILQRSKDKITGIFRKYRNQAVVVAQERHTIYEVDIDPKKGIEVEDYDKVVVQITHWPAHRAQSLRGHVLENLGPSGSNDAEMLSLLVDQGFDLQFSQAVEDHAKGLVDRAEFILEEGRLDYRGVTTITIDPVDAKDFDDALSFQVLENGRIEVGVHIADVSHYVKPGDVLDREAAKRGNSVYLVDRTLPMLPENLSNGLCSLRPDEEKYTFSVLCEFDDKNQLVGHKFSKTLIRSNRRYAYEEAQERIESGEGDFASEIQKMNEIAKSLRARRLEEGSIGFETDEVRFKLDEEGKPISVYVKRRQEAHMMIEDFMLLANRLVAKYIHKKGKGQPIPFPYRVHDQPDEVKLHDFMLLAREFGINFSLSTPDQIAKSMNELMDKAKEDDRYKTLVPMAIRSMSKAEYSTENIGHFGLGFEFYGHFTSPIRRYADLIVHRVLHENLDKVHRQDLFKMDAICAHISNQERKAQEAERESVKYKQAEYLKQHEGEVFTGVVVGIIDRGFFVTLKENLCEGMVSFQSTGERFDVDGLSSSFTGRRTGRHVQLGDEIEVRVENADLFTRRVDLTWVDEDEE